MASSTHQVDVEYPPVDYVVPTFPDLQWPPNGDRFNAIYTIADSWRFTMLWTIILYGLFHVGAAGIALVMLMGKRRSNWKFMWAVPLVYFAIAGLEALVAGSIVGVVIGAVYINGKFIMSTWVPFVWAWINVLVLIISSFSIQGGL
jgi:hypothetical protein